MVDESRAAAGSDPAPAGDPAARAAAPAGRRSIASSRRSRGDRTTVIIGVVVLVLMTVGVVIGLRMNRTATAVPEDGYGPSTRAVATIDDATIVVAAADAADTAVTIDIYEDPIQPAVTTLVEQYQQQMAKAIDDGSLVVRFHPVASLDPASVSGDYSTRAVAALFAVADTDGQRPGVWWAFHSALFDGDNQPERISDGARSDLTDDQLAALAQRAGVSQRGVERIASGAEREVAVRAAEANLYGLAAIWEPTADRPATPTVTHDGEFVRTNDIDWLTVLISADDGEAAA